MSLIQIPNVLISKFEAFIAFSFVIQKLQSA